MSPSDHGSEFDVDPSQEHPSPDAINDKPQALEVNWQPLSKSYLFESHWYNLRQDEIVLPSGQKATYTYVEHPGSVFVIPVTTDNDIVLIRSYRYTIDEWCWEIPAGTLGDCKGLSPEEVAAEELRQEIGAAFETLESLGHYFLSNGIAKLEGHFFLARNVSIRQTLSLEPTEVIGRVEHKSIAEVQNMLTEGKFRDGDSAFGLLLALRRLAVGA